MAGVFISYRREDTAGHTGRLFDRLEHDFGRDRVFMDISGIEPGVDFTDAIRQAVGSCELLLVVIGRDWLNLKDTSGRRRLDDPDDYVRLETTTALERGIRVIPVLVEGSSIPRADQLPPELQRLTRLQAFELRDSRWDADLTALVVAMRKILGAVASPPGTEKPVGVFRKRPGLVIGILAVMIGFGVVVLLSRVPSIHDLVLSRASARRPASVQVPQLVSLAGRDDQDAALRRTYIDHAAHNREEILFVTKSGERTPLAGRGFSEASIRARRDVLALVSVYARRLAGLAGSKGPTTVGNDADVLATLTDLAKTFELRADSDPSAAAYIGPASSLVGLIAQMAAEKSQDIAIKHGIERGTKPVNAILNQMERDMSSIVVAPGVAPRASEQALMVAELINEYNNNRTRLTPDALLRLTDQIATASDTYFRVLASGPTGLVAGLTDLHQAMLTYAGSPREAADLGDLASALELFASQVDAVAVHVHMREGK